jgi:DNA-binding response OmpR family regulator
MVAKRKPNAALLDYMLPDGRGVELAQQLCRAMPDLQVIMMTGSMLADGGRGDREEHGFPVLRKPFLATDVMNQIFARGPRAERTIAPPNGRFDDSPRALYKCGVEQSGSSLGS